MSLGSFRGPDDIVQRLRSLPIKTHWAGFESDTNKMQQAGWIVSALQDVASMQMQLAFSREGGQFNSGTPNKLRGISSRIPYDFIRQSGMYGYYDREEIVMEIQAIGSRVHMHEHGGVDRAVKFHPIDATPQMWSGRITSLDDWGHFVPAGNVDRLETVVMPHDESVEELLARILDKQQSAKVARATAQYYDEKDSGLLVPRVCAKIIQLNKAA